MREKLILELRFGPSVFYFMAMTMMIKIMQNCCIAEHFNTCIKCSCSIYLTVCILENGTISSRLDKMNTSIALLLLIVSVLSLCECSMKPSVEPMLSPDPMRFSIFPIKNVGMWDMYKK